MTSLSLVHKNREESGTDIVPRKTYFAGLKEFYVETGYNVREIDQQHCEEFRDAYMAGEYVPPLVVQVTERGLKIIDGHHRYYGALMAVESGCDIVRLECQDAKGSEADRIALMITSSQGRALLPLERAAAYQRLLNQGWTEAEVAKKVKRSVADVNQHLELLGVGDGLAAMVKSGEVAATTAVALAREHGAKADSVAQVQLEKAKAEGKKKLTRAAAIPQFSATKARRLVELMAQFDFNDDGYAAADDVYLEAMGIISEWREKHGKAPATEPVGEETATEELSDDEMPLTRAEILEKSGVEVWACAAAMFGDKDDYTFNESRFAHSWSADSFDNPTLVIVPADVIAKAQRMKQKKLDYAELKAWIAAQHSDLSPESAEDKFNRISSVAIETRIDTTMSMAEFISLMEKVDRSNWDNIRMLRAAINELVGQVTIPDIGEGA